MSTTTLAQNSTLSDDDQHEESGDAYEYRAIHTGAILGLLIALLSLVFPLTVTSFADIRQAALLSIIPIIGLLVAFWALTKIRANRDLYTGAPAAILGIVLAGSALVLGAARGGYVYATEVPEGYQRTSFLDMKPDEVEVAARQMITPEVEPLLGQKVFIKGYIRPDSTNNGLRKGITEFLLVRDNNQCCFGDASKVMYYDQVKVNLGPGMSTDLEGRVFNIGGELGVRPGIVARGEPPLVYSLKADYLK